MKLPLVTRMKSDRQRNAHCSEITILQCYFVCRLVKLYLVRISRYCKVGWDWHNWFGLSLLQCVFVATENGKFFWLELSFALDWHITTALDWHITTGSLGMRDPPSRISKREYNMMRNRRIAFHPREDIKENEIKWGCRDVCESLTEEA